MTPAHFKEVVETVCKTTGRSKREVRDLLGVCEGTLYNWENKSFPVRKQLYAIHSLRQIWREYLECNDC